MSEDTKPKMGRVSRWEDRQARRRLKELKERGAEIEKEEDELGTLERLQQNEL